MSGLGDSHPIDLSGPVHWPHPGAHAMTTDQQTPDELSTFADLMRREEEFPGRGYGIDPRVRRARRRRGWIITAVVFLLLFGGSGAYVGWALTAPLAAPDAVVANTPVVAAPAAATLAFGRRALRPSASRAATPTSVRPRAGSGRPREPARRARWPASRN